MDWEGGTSGALFQQEKGRGAAGRASPRPSFSFLRVHSLPGMNRAATSRTSHWRVFARAHPQSPFAGYNHATRTLFFSIVRDGSLR